MTRQHVFIVRISDFVSWLESRGASAATTTVYAGRLRGLLASQGLNTDDRGVFLPELRAARERPAFFSYFSRLAPSTRASAVTAWNALAEYSREKGGPDDTLSPITAKSAVEQVQWRSTTQGIPLVGPSEPAALSIPVDVLSALWAILDKNTVPQPVAGALRWGHVAFVGGSSPVDAVRADIVSPEGEPWRWSDLRPWRVVWAWSCGDRSTVEPSDAFLAAARGSGEPWSMEEVQRLYRDGGRQLVPAFFPLPEAVAPTATPHVLTAPPTMVFPPGFVPPADDDD